MFCPHSHPFYTPFPDSLSWKRCTMGWWNDQHQRQVNAHERGQGGWVENKTMQRRTATVHLLDLLFANLSWLAIFPCFTAFCWIKFILQHPLPAIFRQHEWHEGAWYWPRLKNVWMACLICQGNAQLISVSILSMNALIWWECCLLMRRFWNWLKNLSIWNSQFSNVHLRGPVSQRWISEWSLIHWWHSRFYFTTRPGEKII